MKKSLKTVILVAIPVFLLFLCFKLWTNYSHRAINLEMDMCDENGNVIHVTVDGVLRRGWGEPWKFKGEICYDGKIFTDWEEYRDGLVPLEFKASGKIMGLPKEWLNSFEVADREDGTYYFMPYQRQGEIRQDGHSRSMVFREDDSVNYFGPASTGEEAKRIRDLWVQVIRGN